MKVEVIKNACEMKKIANAKKIIIITIKILTKNSN